MPTFGIWLSCSHGGRGKAASRNFYKCQPFSHRYCCQVPVTSRRPTIMHEVSISICGFLNISKQGERFCAGMLEMTPPSLRTAQALCRSSTKDFRESLDAPALAFPPENAGVCSLCNQVLLWERAPQSRNPLEAGCTQRKLDWAHGGSIQQSFLAGLLLLAWKWGMPMWLLNGEFTQQKGFFCCNTRGGWIWKRFTSKHLPGSRRSSRTFY